MRRPITHWIGAASIALVAAIATGGCTSDAVEREQGRQVDQLLALSADANDPQSITKLVALGADIEARTPDGKTPLIVAANGNRIEAARALIDAGADVN